MVDFSKPLYGNQEIVDFFSFSFNIFKADIVRKVELTVQIFKLVLC